MKTFLYLKKMKTQSQKDTRNPMFTAVLFTTTKIGKQTKSPLTAEWIKMMWYTHTHRQTHTYTMEYYSTIKGMK